jgi:hypothetical protein
MPGDCSERAYVCDVAWTARATVAVVYEELIDTKCPDCLQRIRPVSYETAGKVVNIECGCLDPAWKR